MGVVYMFIGRERELASLRQLYNSDKFEFVVLYGRRRVGKTALINHFIDGKKAIYFMGVESNAKQNLENFSKSIIEYASGIEAETSFASFQAALETVFRLSEKERIILAIDEYPYVARASKSLASTLQLLIDKHKDRSKLMLILCGSSMSYMEDHVLAYKAPLYGRRTAQIKLQPFDFEETCRCFGNFCDEEKALAYGIVGGTPGLKTSRSKPFADGASPKTNCTPFSRSAAISAASNFSSSLESQQVICASSASRPAVAKPDFPKPITSTFFMLTPKISKSPGRTARPLRRRIRPRLSFLSSRPARSGGAAAPCGRTGVRSGS